MVSSPTLNTTQFTSQYKYPARHWGVQFSLNIVLITTTTFSTWNSKIYTRRSGLQHHHSLHQWEHIPAEVGLKRRPSADPHQQQCQHLPIIIFDP